MSHGSPPILIGAPSSGKRVKDDKFTRPKSFDSTKVAVPSGVRHRKSKMLPDVILQRALAEFKRVAARESEGCNGISESELPTLFSNLGLIQESEDRELMSRFWCEMSDKAEGTVNFRGLLSFLASDSALAETLNARLQEPTSSGQGDEDRSHRLLRGSTDEGRHIGQDSTAKAVKSRSRTMSHDFTSGAMGALPYLTKSCEMCKQQGEDAAAMVRLRALLEAKIQSLTRDLEAERSKSCLLETQLSTTAHDLERDLEAERSKSCLLETQLSTTAHDLKVANDSQAAEEWTKMAALLQENASLQDHLHKEQETRLVLEEHISILEEEVLRVVQDASDDKSEDTQSLPSALLEHDEHATLALELQKCHMEIEKLKAERSQRKYDQRWMAMLHSSSRWRRKKIKAEILAELR
ncbi:hypothetical protein CYMTET_50040 [Cymbomonas tetramitiformis]|uniref:Uncharacterized protein n=1 Tax=Cymbomonas tetramitiformis TaxID=36881 RepID=A0AAE0BNW3_9CHLO|nr:hypothetical protein CYMTET_50040 [Cymbomonas tetramitiformis]